MLRGSTRQKPFRGAQRSPRAAICRARRGLEFLGSDGGSRPSQGPGRVVLIVANLAIKIPASSSFAGMVLVWSIGAIDFHVCPTDRRRALHPSSARSSRLPVSGPRQSADQLAEFEEMISRSSADRSDDLPLLAPLLNSDRRIATRPRLTARATEEEHPSQRSSAVVDASSHGTSDIDLRPFRGTVPIGLTQRRCELLSLS